MEPVRRGYALNVSCEGRSKVVLFTFIKYKVVKGMFACVSEFKNGNATTSNI